MSYQDYINNKRAENPFYSNTELAYSTILNSIIMGYLIPSEKIPLDILSKEFGMSRTPIRDALLRLQDEKFVKYIPNQGFFVCPLHYSDYVALCKFRQALEVQAILWAVQNIDDKALRSLHDNIAITQQFLDKNNYDSTQLLTLDMQFHEIIIKAADNVYLLTAYRNILPKFHFYQQIVRKQCYNHSFTINSHKQIYYAIAKRDTQNATKYMEEHLNFYNRRSIQKVFE